MSRGDVILRLVELSKTYTGKTSVHALKNISTSFKRGEFVAVVGRSGSGKSTLINILGGLDRPSKGDYYCEGNNVARLNEGHWDALRNKKIGFIFQNYFLIEYLTVYQNVEVALQFQNVPKAMKDAKIKEIIEKVGLIDHIHKLPSQLSGGQRQRVAIARALVKDPDIILADEPTGALDWRTADEVIKLLKGESEDRLVVMVTHDRKIANKYANRIIEIENGEFKHDLVKEEIEQTYQNVFRKIQAVTLKSKDKFLMTFNKIKANLVRNFFIAFSLALAFSFSIIFNGLDRGVRTAYNHYYETLDSTYANAFSVIANSEVNERDFQTSNTRINQTLSNEGIKLVTGYSRDVVFNQGVVKNVLNDRKNPDITEDAKLRLLNSAVDYDKLFIRGSKYPSGNRTLMVSSKWIRTFYGLSNDANLAPYVNKGIDISTYQFEIKDEFAKIDELLFQMSEDPSGKITLKGEGKPIIYQALNVPQYCYYKGTLSEYYLRKCQNTFKSHELFNTYDEYIEYMDHFQGIVNLIAPGYFDILERSNGIYYIADFNQLNKVYTYLYSAIELKSSVFVNLDQKVKYTISGILDNEEESLIYLTKENYNRLFEKASSGINFVDGFYTISNKTKNSSLFDRFIGYADKNIGLISQDVIESGSCEVEVISDFKTSDDTIFKDIFYYQDYLACGKNSVASSSLRMLNILFSTFFNTLMLASIVFYSMLIKVIFKARINEIGVFRSVGSTIQDIKRLFFYEVLFIFVNAVILSVLIILGLNLVGNQLFSSLISPDTNVVTIASLKFLIQNGTLIDISLINLAVQIVIVVTIILYYSNRSISKIVNTNPIDILREVV